MGTTGTKYTSLYLYSRYVWDCGDMCKGGGGGVVPPYNTY